MIETNVCFHRHMVNLMNQSVVATTTKRKSYADGDSIEKSHRQPCPTRHFQW
ncbi:MAG TPA: hypothetical protein VEI50_11450 [Nitrospiraceae bacterium]|nr:hypothetical protein [Nitrospiraceae bacterium]